MHIEPIDCIGIASFLTRHAPVRETALHSLLRVADAYSGDMGSEAYVRLGKRAGVANITTPGLPAVKGAIWFVGKMLLPHDALGRVSTDDGFAMYLMSQSNSHARAIGLRLSQVFKRRGDTSVHLCDIGLSLGLWLHSVQQTDEIDAVFNKLACLQIEIDNQRRQQEANAA